jgi:hypothetical protein
MRTTIFACAIAAVALLAGCESGGGDDTTGDDTGDDAGDDTTEPDAPVGALCTGEPYDSCMDTAGGTDCLDGMQCRFFMGHGITICVPPCDVDNPCPDNEVGPVDCNQQGRCDPGVANSCTLP